MRRGLRARTLGTAAALALSIAWTPAATAAPFIPHAQPPRTAPRPPPPLSASSDDAADLRGRFGVERAARLLRSADGDERLRGLERAAALGTTEAIALLIAQLDATATTHADARAKIAIARGLAPHTDQAPVRSALILVLGLGVPRPSPQRSEADEALYLPRLEVARRIAALALAESGEAHAVESLVAIARGTTTGAAAAMAALVAFPPSGTATWAKPMSAAVAKLVARTGDLRPADDLVAAAGGASGADAPTKGAAMEALATLGDARVLPLATAALADEDPGVRAAATAALVTLGAPGAPAAVEKLLADDATAGRGIDLARVTHGAGIVHALAARAAVAADVAVRSAAVAALGRDPTADGIEALAALVGDPLLRADAADAIARSPSAAAMGAIERLAASPATRRLAARAYVVRVVARRGSSAALERTIAELGRSADAQDRAVGAFTQIVLGEASASGWLADREPLVRRAAAMASLRGGDGTASPAALLARLAVETDAPTRAVLAAGLLDGDDAGRVTTRALLACAAGGGADAPPCTLAFARRASLPDAARVDALLASRDPILRAHAARGLALSDEPTRGGRLAAAYAYEPDPLVRRALVAALAPLASAPGAPASLVDAMTGAARLDPDPEIRAAAAHPATTDVAGAPSAEADIAWIHLVDAGGAPPPAGATATLLRADGLAVPIAFDADGDALVPGLPPGTSRLALAPRAAAAYSPSP